MSMRQGVKLAWPTFYRRDSTPELVIRWVDADTDLLELARHPGEAAEGVGAGEREAEASGCEP